MRRVLVIFTLFFFKSGIYSTNLNSLPDTIYLNSYCLIDTTCFSELNLERSGDKRPNPILLLFKAKQKKNKKITAAVLAFPFPFGMVGLHRIYLGTAPYVPVVYIGTLGGVLGILPFIDFCVIVLDKNVDRYIENKNVLMWVDDKKPVK